MRGFPLRISKEKILSLRSSKIKDLQNRPKTFQLLAQFAIKIPEYSTPYIARKCREQNTTEFSEEGDTRV